MKVIVLGGGGYLGSKVVDAFTRAGVHEVQVAGRRGPVVVDVCKPETFSALLGADLVINCSDSLVAPPEDVIAYCLEQGLCFVETTSEPETVRRLLDRFRGKKQAQDFPGRVLLGAGIFTGISNLLAGDLAKRGHDRLRLGIRWSPFSAGGGGMVGLVPHMTTVPVVFVRDGKVVYGKEVEPAKKMAFVSGTHPALGLPFAESSMLAYSTNARDVEVVGSIAPSLLTRVFALTPVWLLKLKLMRMWLWLQFTILRRFLLRSVKSFTELSATGESEEGTRETWKFRVEDGMLLAGEAAMVMALKYKQNEERSGMHLPDESMDLDEVLQGLKAREVAFVLEQE